MIQVKAALDVFVTNVAHCVSDNELHTINIFCLTQYFKKIHEPLKFHLYLFLSAEYLERKEMAIQEREMPIKHLREKRKEERNEILKQGEQY